MSSEAQDLEQQDSLQSPIRSLRKRKSVDYSEQNLAQRSRRTSSVKASTVPDLDFIREGDESDGEENDEAFIPSSVLNEAQDGSGKTLFGFQTPKKAGGMAMKVAEEMRRTPLSEKKTPQKTTPYKSSSNPTTPRGILKTPTSGKKGGGRFEPETPRSAKKRVKKTIIKISENNITHNYSDHSDTEEEEEEDKESEEENRPIMKGPPATPRTPARKGRRAKPGRDLDQHSLAESYFSAQSQPVLTSDRTLARLKTPRLSDTEVNKLLKSSKTKYDLEVREQAESGVRNDILFPGPRTAAGPPRAVSPLDVAAAQRLLHRLLRPRLQEKSPPQVPRGIPAGEGYRGGQWVLPFPHTEADIINHLRGHHGDRGQLLFHCGPH